MDVSRRPAHSGEATGSSIKQDGPRAEAHAASGQGSILSTPAVVDGYVYVGLANSPGAATADGSEVDAATGRPVEVHLEHQFSEVTRTAFAGWGAPRWWTAASTKAHQRADLLPDANTLKEKWITRSQLRRHEEQSAGHQRLPQWRRDRRAEVSGWSSPAVVNGRALRRLR